MKLFYFLISTLSLIGPSLAETPTQVELTLQVSLAHFNMTCLEKIERFYTQAIEENLLLTSQVPLQLVVDVQVSSKGQVQTQATLHHQENSTQYNLGPLNWGDCQAEFSYSPLFKQWSEMLMNSSVRELQTLFTFPNNTQPQSECLKIEKNVAPDEQQSESEPESSSRPHVLVSTALTLTAASFEVPSEHQLLPPAAILEFEVPAELQEQNLETIVIHHRQDPNSPSNKNWSKGKWDDNPGLSSVQVWDGQCWRYWDGSASGELGAKFAEISHSMEIENLYEWAKLGHRCIDGSGHSQGPLKALKIRVISSGVDPVIFSHLELRTYPQANQKVQMQTEIYSPETSFADFTSSQGVHYGGGQDFSGLFPRAKALGPALSYSIPAGRKLQYVEVSCGDSHPDKKTNEDGGTGSKGWGKLNIFIQRQNGARDYLVRYANVAPQSVISGSPTAEQSLMNEGDSVVVEGQSDTVYVMGVRITYE